MEKMRIRKEVVIPVELSDIENKICVNCKYRQFYETVKKQTEFIRPSKIKEVPIEKLPKQSRNILTVLRERLKGKEINRQTFYTAIGKDFSKIPDRESISLSRTFQYLKLKGYLAKVGIKRVRIGKKRYFLTCYELKR